MEEAIRTAIEKGGYKDQLWPEAYESLAVQNMVALDPLFWQALGRALGREDSKCSSKCGSVYPEYVNGCVRCGKGIDPDPNMLYHALRYFELKLTRGDEEKFWKQLLKK